MNQQQQPPRRGSSVFHLGDTTQLSLGASQRSKNGMDEFVQHVRDVLTRKKYKVINVQRLVGQIRIEITRNESISNTEMITDGIYIQRITQKTDTNTTDLFILYEERRWKRWIHFTMSLMLMWDRILLFFILFCILYLCLYIQTINKPDRYVFLHGFVSHFFF